MWKVIKEYPSYAVSNDGRVMRVDAAAGTRPGKILKPQANYRGALRVHLCRTVDGKRTHRKCWVHRLVLEAFVGPCPEGMECCHNDGNNQNNQLSNLRWDTPKANQADRVRHGTHPQGVQNPRVKLTEGDVFAIRYLCEHGYTTQTEIAELWGIARETVKDIKARRTWGWLKVG